MTVGRATQKVSEPAMTNFSFHGTARDPARPFYQRNDYLSWVTRAKRIETRIKRMEQMLDELEVGGVYMGMDHPPSRKS